MKYGCIDFLNDLSNGMIQGLISWFIACVVMIAGIKTIVLVGRRANEH